MTEPFAAGLYFDIYYGAWKLDTPRTIQHVVTIKILHPRDKADGHQEFEDVRLCALQVRSAVLMFFLTVHLAAPQVSSKVG